MNKQNTYEKKNKKNTIPEALISTKEKHIKKEEPIQRMERFGARPKNKNFVSCRFCNASNWTPMHKCPALDANCNKCGQKGHYANVCRKKTNNNRMVKRLTENELNERKEPSSESEDSIHHIKEIKKIDETNKHFTTTLTINGVMKEFIIDTGSPISLMPPDERITQSTKIQKITNRYQDVNNNEVKFRGKIPVDVEYENNKQKNGSGDNQKNRYDTITRDGLNEEIQTNDRQNTMGRQQPIRIGESFQQISGPI